MQSLLGLVLLTILAIAHEPPRILAETSASCRCGGAPPLGGWPARRCASGHQGRPRQPDGEICSQWGWKFHSYSQNSIWILTSARGRPSKLSLHVGAEDQKRCNSAVLLWACEIAILNGVTSVPAAPRMNFKKLPSARCGPARAMCLHLRRFLLLLGHLLQTWSYPGRSKSELGKTAHAADEIQTSEIGQTQNRRACTMSILSQSQNKDRLQTLS